MIIIFNENLSSEHIALARHQNNSIKIPITIYYSNVEQYRFSSGFNMDTGKEVVQRYRDYFWINKPEPPMRYFCGYRVGVKITSTEQRYLAGYSVKFSQRTEYKYRSMFKRHFLFGERIRYNYKAGYKLELGKTRFKLNYRTAFRVSNAKRDPLFLNYKCSYRYSRRSETEFRYTDYFNVILINRIEQSYKAGYRHSVSKFVFPRKYNKNAAGANTTIAELPTPWKIIKQKDGSSGIRIALDKEKLNLGTDGIRIYLNFPPKYINYCAVMRDKFEKLSGKSERPHKDPIQPPPPPPSEKMKDGPYVIDHKIRFQYKNVNEDSEVEDSPPVYRGEPEPEPRPEPAPERREEPSPPAHREEPAPAEHGPLEPAPANSEHSPEPTPGRREEPAPITPTEPEPERREEPAPTEPAPAAPVPVEPSPARVVSDDPEDHGALIKEYDAASAPTVHYRNEDNVPTDAGYSRDAYGNYPALGDVTKWVVAKDSPESARSTQPLYLDEHNSLVEWTEKEDAEDDQTGYWTLKLNEEPTSAASAPDTTAKDRDVKVVPVHADTRLPRYRARSPSDNMTAYGYQPNKFGDYPAIVPITKYVIAYDTPEYLKEGLPVYVDSKNSVLEWVTRTDPETSRPESYWAVDYR